MKVVLVSFLFDPILGGGSAVVVHNLAHALQEHGVEVVVITSAPNRHPIVETIDGIRVWKFYPPNLYWVYDKDRQPVWKKILWQLLDTWNPFVYQIFKRILLEEKPDVVHVHKLRGLSPTIWSAARAVRVPKLLHTCHDFEIASPEGLLMGKVGQWAKEQAIIMRPYQTIRRSLSNLVDSLTTPSSFLANEYKRLQFFSKAKNFVIPNTHGIDENNLGKLKKQNFEKKVGSPVKFLYLGRLDRSKGVSLLLNVFQSHHIRNLNLQLTLVGNGAMEDEIKERIVNDGRINYLGPRFGEQKARILSENDVLVMPSLAPESFGISAVEAFAYGMPVIASKIGGLPEVVDQRTGWLFEPGNVSQLVKIIQNITLFPDQISQKRISCFEDANNYSIDRFVANYLSLYNDDL